MLITHLALASILLIEPIIYSSAYNINIVVPDLTQKGSMYQTRHSYLEFMIQLVKIRTSYSQVILIIRLVFKFFGKLVFNNLT